MPAPAVLRLALLPLLVAPVANATVGSGGVVHEYLGARPTSSKKKRLQIVNAIFSQGVAGFDPTKEPWTTVRAPHAQTKTKKKRQHVFLYDIESSRTPGKYTRVRVEYADRHAAGHNALFGPVRKATSKLVDTNRKVRVGDGGLGWMVGAGHHLSYAGLIELYKPKGACRLCTHTVAKHVHMPLETCTPVAFQNVCLVACFLPRLSVHMLPCACCTTLLTLGANG